MKSINTAVLDQTDRTEAGRRRYTTAYKLQLLEESSRPGSSVSRVARRHNINTNTLFRWRREHQNGELVPDGSLAGAPAPNEFVAVGMVDDEGIVAMLPPPERKPSHDAVEGQDPGGALGSIEVILRDGIVVRMSAEVPDRTLRRVLFIAREVS